jgi:hypothetical protein
MAHITKNINILMRIINLFENEDFINEKYFRYEYLDDQCFKTKIGSKIADAISAELPWKDNKISDEQAYQLKIKVINPIQGYLNNLLMRVRSRHEDMSEWFSLEHLSLQDIIQKANNYRNSFVQSTDDEEEHEYDDDEGHMGFASYDPEMDNFYFIRFGKIPKTGKSNFGLAKDDTEDYQDEWRKETCNKTHEDGVSVFQAYRHHNDPDGWIIQMPNFSLARYGISNEETYLQSILPANVLCKWQKNHSTPVVHLILGSIVKSVGKKKIYAELGSDGEYLIDTSKPFKTSVIPLENIYISEKNKLVDWLNSIDYFNRQCDEI